MKLGFGLVLAVVLGACGCAENEKPSGGGRGGTAGSSSSGASGSAGASGSGGSFGGDLNGVASALDGFVMTQPCVARSGPRACRTHPPGLCPKHADPARSGARPTDATLSLGGRPGVLYDVTLRVQGIVEPRVYVGGTDASDVATNGFLTNGAIDNAKTQHSVYALRATAPESSYFFNSLGRENLRHSVFALDYEATVTISGGASLELFVSDPNCEALRNCGDPDVPSECVPVDMPDLAPKIRESLGTDPAAFDGQFLGFTVKQVAERR